VVTLAILPSTVLLLSFSNVNGLRTALMLFFLHKIVSAMQLAFSRFNHTFPTPRRVDIIFANDYTVFVSSWSFRHDSESELILGEMLSSTPWWD
jgi:hypothetical protein